MSGYFLLTICVEPTANPTSVLSEAANAIRKGFKGTSGELRYLFKVVGENVLCCIMKGSVDVAMQEVNLSCGNFIRTCCHPLRTYENFSQKVLNVDATLAKQPEKPYHLKGDAFLLEFKVEYQGKSMEELIGTWQREAQAALTVREQGMELELYKVVGERRVYCLVNGDAGTIDDIIFNLPIMKENGDHVLLKTKGVVAFQ